MGFMDGAGLGPSWLCLHRPRPRSRFAAATIVIQLVSSGLWVIDHLRARAPIEVCVEAGHRNCMPLDPAATQTVDPFHANQ